MHALTIIQWNCRSLRSKINQFRLLVSSYAPDIIVLQETHLNDFVSDEVISLRNYQSFRKDREGMEGWRQRRHVHLSESPFH